MADTLQIVRWALERKCRYRSGENWHLPVETSSQLADLRTVARAANDGRIADGVCVTSWTGGHDNSGNYYDIPHDGFRVDERLAPFGGFDQANRTCGNCEANVESKLENQIAGCFGYLEVWPNSEELEDLLWEVIRNRGLEDRLRNAFQVTKPLWYGFWIESPLRRRHAEVLLELFEAACEHDSDQDRDDGSIHFIHALKAAINWELPLHVSLAPLGHTDLGWYTVFPHCPRCKANAPVGRWQEEFPSETVACEVCEHLFNPNEHHSAERMDDDWEADSLESQLGEEAFEQFSRRFLSHQGCSDQQVEEVIDNENNGPLLREISKVRRQRKTQIRQLREKRETISEAMESPSLISVSLNDDVEMDFVLAPVGEFKMGSPDLDENSTESPQHSVRFEKPFYIGRFTVTQSQWQAVMGRSQFRQEHPDLPAEPVSWLDCQSFCRELSKRHQRVFRLPSEAEWEYACRAGTTTRFAFGDTLSADQANFTPIGKMFGALPESELQAVNELEQLAEMDPEERAEEKAKPKLVGSYSPNAWGLYDMHGNVDEWCEDVWHPNYEGAPQDGNAWLTDEESQPFRVMRGGWCSATEFVCTSTSRRQLRADAGSRSEEELKQSEDGEDDEDGWFLATIFEMMYTPYGFRVVCEI